MCLNELSAILKTTDILYADFFSACNDETCGDVIFFVVTCVMLVVVLVCHFRILHLKEKIIVSNAAYEAAVKEMNDIKEIAESAPLQRDTHVAIAERLFLVNRFAVSKLSTSVSEDDALAGLIALMLDVEHFLESTRQCFVVVHPGFMKYLTKHGLSHRETSICCLYCIGLNGNEISEYLKLPSLYNISSCIRRKLKIGRQVNIDTYLREKVRDFDFSDFNTDA
ncbi:MAG: hypothetical protein K2O58_09985 [Bacteroidales bacterium]|nr:hypothetical protein [Bacteroidales bacterium]MDE7128199.1 hypothetical protein [Bacteroidales bacterium]